jgi:hypothetical protein
VIDVPKGWTEAVGVELRQLEYFLAVVEEGSFTRAVARLYMVQSSLSASLLGRRRSSAPTCSSAVARGPS